MKQPIYNTALYVRLSRDDELQGESSSITTLLSGKLGDTAISTLF
ncbi:hypothetical protein HNQ56_004856 [Anaerotaenia torta]